MIEKKDAILLFSNNDNILYIKKREIIAQIDEKSDTLNAIVPIGKKVNNLHKIV